MLPRLPGTAVTRRLRLLV